MTIYPASEEEVRSGDIGRRLRQFNYGVIGEYPEVQPIRLNAREGERVVGGLRAIVAFYWLRVELLFVDEPVRGKGVGSALLAEAEKIARALGARNAAVETFEWQAPAFYEKHGYVEATRLEGYVPNYYLAIMRKAL